MLNNKNSKKEGSASDQAANQKKKDAIHQEN
jgi:hypothetical protein